VDVLASPIKAISLVAALTEDERRMLWLTVDGYSLVKIAAQADQSLEEAVLMKAEVLYKLGVTTTADLVRIGLCAQAGLDC
jgi:DNA-binding CsgD family transcriptional regulator